MGVKQRIQYEPSVRPVYVHLDPLVDILLAHGSRLAFVYRWAQNRTGFYCPMTKPIDFDLIEQTFDLPDFVRLDREGGAIECDSTWARIVGPAR
jgi:hypothetical protein